MKKITYICSLAIGAMCLVGCEDFLDTESLTKKNTGNFPMTEVEPGVFESEVLELHAGEEFKVRQGGSWDVNFGVDGENFKVEEDGNYIVRFTFDGENGTIELIAQ